MASMSLGGFFKDLMREQFTRIPKGRYRPMDGKVVIITGSNRGLGLEAAKWMARLNADTVILAVRRTAKGEEARKHILQKTKSKTNVLVWELDLMSFASVRAFAEKCQGLPRLDALILNAAIVTETWRTSEDGWESNLQTNALSNAYLSLLLYPLLIASADGTVPLPHISIVSSDLYYLSPFRERNEPNILNVLNDKSLDPMRNKKWTSTYDFANILDRYKTSKLLAVYVSRAIAEYVSVHNPGQIVVNALNPGFAPTKAGDEVYTGVRRVFLVFGMVTMARSIKNGSRMLVHAATQTGVEAHGAYLSACKTKSPGKFLVGPEGPALQAKVWNEIGEILIRESPELQIFFS